MFLSEHRTRRLFVIVLLALTAVGLAAFFVVQRLGNEAGWLILALVAGAMLVILGAMIWYFHGQSQILAAAIAQIQRFLAGDQMARIDCDEEGELYRLFHEVNTLSAILSTHAENESNARRFLKDTLSDISHQLKTPLATLGIYNGIMQDETTDLATLREFSVLSEQELDRIDSLVKNLLTIAKLDAGTLNFVKRKENLQEMMESLSRHFSLKASYEKKTLHFSGESDVTLVCDRVWILEALSNIIKNAFDHTSAGCTITVEWRHFAQIVQIVVRDDGAGIHPEDLPFIFKRFYRSRFSTDTQGAGLGLPLAKAIIGAHSGTVEVDSVLGQGTMFTINFLSSINPTEM